MKRIGARFALIALTLAVGLVLTLGGCGGGDGEVATLTIWQTYNDEESIVFRDIVRRFEESHPGVTIDVVPVPFGGAEPKIQMALTTHTEPDIVRVDVAFLPKLARMNALAVLDEHVPASYRADILPVALKSCMYEGSLYGLPDQTNGLCLFYNRQLFREAGLDPDTPPSTWDELIEYGKRLTDKSKERYGIGLTNSLWWSLPFFYTYGADLLSDDMTRCTLNTPEAVEAFQLKVDLFARHGIEGGAWRAGGISGDIGFRNGRYAMILNGPWAVESLKEAGIDFGVGTIPAGPAGSHTNVGGNNLVVFKSCPRAALAAEFLMFVANEENQRRWALELGQIPVNTRAVDAINTEEHPYLATFVEQMQTAIPRPPTPYYPEIESKFVPEMQAALDGSKPVAAALDAAVREVDKLLAGN